MASIVIRNLNDLLGRLLKERAARTGRTIEEEGRGIMEAALSQPETPERQREQVGKRLNRLLNMLNEARGTYSFNVPDMASYLRLNTASDLESYFLGEREAPFELLDQIAETFGVKPDWLKFGHGTEPFKRGSHRGDLLKLIQTVQPQMVYFVRALDEVGSATVFFRVAKWKYEGIRDYWHVSKKVGATGERQLFELWQVLDKIEKNTNVLQICSGRDLPSHLYLALVRGEVFPGAVLEGQEDYRSNWFDDFADIDHTYPIAKDGYAHYGKEFVDAQAIVFGYRNSRKRAEEGLCG